MICPHCGKEVDGYIDIGAQNLFVPNINGAAGALRLPTVQIAVADANNGGALAFDPTVNVAACGGMPANVHIVNL